MQEEGRDPDKVLISSCARGDAKPVDRDKQMKYDIAKNGEGPLTKTVKQPEPNLSPTSALDSQQTPPSLAHEKKRKIGDLDLDQAAAASKSKSKRSKGKEKETETAGEALDEGNEETIDARLTADDMPAVNERLKNIEEHFALRYGECILSIPTM